MLPPAFGKVGAKTKTPHFSILVCGIVGGMVAALVPLSVLGELISIGTLLAFIIVSTGVVTLRRRYPDLERPFRVPFLPLVAAAWNEPRSSSLQPAARAARMHAPKM